MIEKMLRDFMYPGTGERLADIERKADETLHDWLVRCQSELTDRVVVLAAVRDGYIATLGLQRGRWRRRKLLLALTGPAIAALAYAGIAWCGIGKSVPAPLIAVLIAGAGLAGAPLAIGIARIADRLPGWLAMRQARKWDRFSSRVILRSRFERLVGGALRRAATMIESDAVRRMRAQDSEWPDDEDLHPSPAPRAASESDSDSDYIARTAELTETALRKMDRATVMLERKVTLARMVVALRFRQLLYLEAGAATFIVGLFLLFPDTPMLMRLIILILAPIALARGGRWFVNNAAAIGEALDRHAQRWGR